MAYYNKKRKKNKKVEDNYQPPFEQSILGQKVEILGLRQNTLELLQGSGVALLNDLLKKSEKDLYKIKTFNKKNLLDVNKALEKRKLFLKPLDNAEGSEKVVEKAPAATEKHEKGKKNDNNKKVAEPKFADVSEAKSKKEHEKLRPKKTVPVEVKDIYVKINKNGLWGFQDRATGKEIIKPAYADVFLFKEDLCCVELEEKFGYIDREGKFVIEPRYDMASSFSEGYACVYEGEKCGYIDREGNVVVPFDYDAGTAVSESSCRVKRNGQWGELNFSDGKPLEIRWII